MRLGRSRDRSTGVAALRNARRPEPVGHERIWLPPTEREVAREMRMRAAAAGLRAPVQVMDGNYKLMSGTCPWWDGVKGKG